jgi:hypothetical protein
VTTQTPKHSHLRLMLCVNSWLQRKRCRHRCARCTMLFCPTMLNTPQQCTGPCHSSNTTFRGPCTQVHCLARQRTFGSSIRLCISCCYQGFAIISRLAVINRGLFCLCGPLRRPCWVGCSGCLGAVISLSGWDLLSTLPSWGLCGLSGS